MFCPNCGKTADKKLKYCSGCGERLSKAAEIDKDGTPGKMLDNILTTLFLVVLFGLGILIGLVAVLLGNGVIGPIVVIIVAYLAVISGICFMLLKEVPKLIDARLKAMNLEPTRSALPSPATTAQLEEYREPAMSVTEHTTRTLVKVPVKDA